MGTRSTNFLLQTEQQGKKSLERQALQSVPSDGLEQGDFLKHEPLEPIIRRRTAFVMQERSRPLSSPPGEPSSIHPPSSGHQHGQGQVHPFGDTFLVTVLLN